MCAFAIEIYVARPGQADNHFSASSILVCIAKQLHINFK